MCTPVFITTKLSSTIGCCGSPNGCQQLGSATPAPISRSKPAHTCRAVRPLQKDACSSKISLWCTLNGSAPGCQVVGMERKMEREGEGRGKLKSQDGSKSNWVP